MHHQARVSPTVDGPVRTFSVPQVPFGPGTLSEVGVGARRLGGVRVFVISDPGVVEAGWAHEALTTMDAEFSARRGSTRSATRSAAASTCRTVSSTASCCPT